MKKNTPIIVVVAIVAILAVVSIASYNSLVSGHVSVEEQQANIDNQLQRRADLIPNLVETVKSFTEHETAVFDAVNTARENLVNASTMEEKAEANAEVDEALSQLIAIAESYPELQSDTVYVSLMDELAGTENRIAYARTDYNSAVASYNRSLRAIPTNIFAGMFGFEEAEYFEATEDAETVPEVDLE